MVSWTMMGIDIGRQDVVRLAVACEGVDFSVREGWTGLLWATKSFAEKPSQTLLDIIEYLLAEKASPTSRNLCGDSAMSFAAKSGSVPLVQLLVRFGASIVSDESQNLFPLHLAAASAHHALVAYLCMNGVQTNACDSQGSTALFFAAFNADRKTLDILLDFGAKVSHCKSDGRTALHEAAFAGKAENVAILLENGAKNVADNLGYSPLIEAISNGHLEVVKVLVASGIDLHQKMEKFQPIFFSLPYLEVFQFLEQAGCDLDQRDQEGQSLLERADACRALEVAAYLRAKQNLKL
jgi:ankyrin repeat protein